MKNLIGMKWGELKEETKEWFLERCNCVDGVTCNNTDEGECIVDLDFNLSVSGIIKDGEIVIEDYAKIYNPTDEFIDIEIDNSLDDVLTASEAAETWGITEGSIRAAIKSRRLILGIDFRKAGRITLITKSAMKRLYGEMPERIIKAVKKYDDEHLKKGDVITFTEIIEKTKNIFDQEMWVVRLASGGIYNLIPDDFEIQE